MIRLLADLLLIGMAALLPWWLVLLSAAVLFFVFEKYVEFMLIALFSDLLYGAPLPRFFDFQFVLSLGAVFLSVLFTFVKKRMRV
ncbi:MAG: hypothetical protein UY50_C0008G0012 [Parcubacteria group bacterium GW2011_GWA2_49_9]|nr:MAG: hypothetical protein UY50_C0008G0012 [Parcubacteria group bacterium GW2011_GWA2_49_9]